MALFLFWMLLWDKQEVSWGWYPVAWQDGGKTMANPQEHIIQTKELRTCKTLKNPHWFFNTCISSPLLLVCIFYSHVRLNLKIYTLFCLLYAYSEIQSETRLLLSENWTNCQNAWLRASTLECIFLSQDAGSFVGEMVNIQHFLYSKKLKVQNIG